MYETAFTGCENVVSNNEFATTFLKLFKFILNENQVDIEYRKINIFFIDILAVYCLITFPLEKGI